MDNAQILNMFVTRGEFDSYKAILQRIFDDYEQRIKALEDIKAEYETKQQSKTKKDKQ